MFLSYVFFSFNLAMSLLIKSESIKTDPTLAEDPVPSFPVFAKSTLALCSQCQGSVLGFLKGLENPKKFIHKLFKPLLSISSNIKIACSSDSGKWLFYRNFIIIHNGINTEKYKYSIDVRSN